MATWTSGCSTILSAVQLAFIRGCFRSARPTAATRRSVCVMRTPCDFSIVGSNASRAALSAVASTSRVRKKCGTEVQLWVVRSAMRRAIELRASAAGAPVRLKPDTTSESPVRRRAATLAACAVSVGVSGFSRTFSAAARMSSARISPPGPDPCTVARSTP